MNSFNERKESFIKESKKQSRKLIDIKDKGYNAYNLKVAINRKYYALKNNINLVINMATMESKQFDSFMMEDDMLFERIVFLVPKDIEITLENINDYIELNYGYNRYVEAALNIEKYPIRTISGIHDTVEDFTITSPLILDKIESGKMSEKWFNYVVANQDLYPEFSGKTGKRLILTFTDWKEDEKAINSMLKMFGQDPDELLERARNYSRGNTVGCKREDLYKKFENLAPTL
jgi:hypothetical protein